MGVCGLVGGFGRFERGGGCGLMEVLTAGEFVETMVVGSNWFK